MRFRLDPAGRILFRGGRAVPLPPKAANPGTERPLDIRGRYLEHLLGYVEPRKLSKLKVVVNAAYTVYARKGSWAASEREPQVPPNENGR